ncbi:amidohydrolase family protein [Candidatus Daviesbacteria bacterium]|nr:amidohydrolase family protein [Candidatus Daviesbacteria bacterium]
MTKLIKLPGLIDTHVHLREPGATQKEDFETGTKAAIAGGYTLVLDMPNNPDPTISETAINEKITLAKNRIYSDLGFHLGVGSHLKGGKLNVDEFQDLKDRVFGLKVYMNHTTGPLLIEDNGELDLIFSNWPKDKILMVHAETETLAKAITLAKKHGNRLHVCHIARKIELELIIQAKSEGLPVTCEVAMHHLYFTHADEERLGHFAMMRPPLASQEDQDFLWANINSIDTIASDHAPHTREEKEGKKVVNGVPGLETTLPLLLQAVNDERITLQRVTEMTSDSPRKIFNIPEQTKLQTRDYLQNAAGRHLKG